MKLVAAFIFKKNTIRHVEDLQFVSCLKRNSVRELMHEFVRIAAANIQDTRKIFEHPPWQFVLLKLNNQTLGMVTDIEYPVNVSYELLTKLYHDPDVLHNIIRECQDPRTISPVYRIGQQLDEILIIIHENVDKILQE